MGTIATQLRVHHYTVERVLSEAGVQRERQRRRRASKLDPYRAFITETLERFPSRQHGRGNDHVTRAFHAIDRGDGGHERRLEREAGERSAGRERAGRESGRPERELVDRGPGGASGLVCSPPGPRMNRTRIDGLRARAPVDSLPAGSRDCSLGCRLAPEAASAPDLSFGLPATRRESDAKAPEHSIRFEVRAQWCDRANSCAL